MSFRLQCLSHSPLMEFVRPSAGTERSAREALSTLRLSFDEFNPQLIVLFAPDHYNGFFYDLMPAFCLGVHADTIGDFGTAKGALPVPAEVALECAEAVLAADIDVAVSYRMKVDHGFAQPLEILTGAIDRYPVIPIFVNSVAEPMPSFKRARLLGEAVGTFCKTLGKRVTFVGSGGLSHNPPVPTIKGAPAETAERLIAGRDPSAEDRAARTERTIEAARQFAAGTSKLRPLNPQWDRKFLSTLESRDLSSLDEIDNASVTRDAGASAHEVKTWVAATAAMAAATSGRYRVRSEHYSEIPEWIAGFATLEGFEAT